MSREGVIHELRAGDLSFQERLGDPSQRLLDEIAHVRSMRGSFQAGRVLPTNRIPPRHRLMIVEPRGRGSEHTVKDQNRWREPAGGGQRNFNHGLPGSISAKTAALPWLSKERT